MIDIVVDGVTVRVKVDDSVNDLLVVIYNDLGLCIYGCHYEHMPVSEWAAKDGIKTVRCNSDTYNLVCETLNQRNQAMGVAFDTDTPMAFRLN